ncbi:MAG: peptidylprolyl isomerase, partial [Gallionella sp.]|nr:peptidylprolyl isomerase [Gallionella sp.]
TEAEAKDIIAQLGKKAKFEKLAAKSKDTGSAAQGGSLGWAVPSNFVREFANALLNLKKGEYTKEPVQSQFGWHVIKLDDTRELKVPSFEEVKPQLQQRLQQQSIKKAIDELRAKAKIE